jgi:hypothetical protein
MLLAAIGEAMHGGSIHVFDRDLRYVYAAGPGLAEVGLTPENLVGRSIGEVFGPDNAALVAPHYGRAFAGQRVHFELPVFGRVFALRSGSGSSTEQLALILHTDSRAEGGVYTMNWSTAAAALALAATPALMSAQTHDDHHDATASNTRSVTLQGCVTPGVDKNTVALTSVNEIAEPGKSVMPAEAHGRRVVFWLMPDKELVNHAGQKVEVRGDAGKIEESEIELKAGRHQQGGLIVEFEGPGKDVKVPNAAVGSAIGTAGRTDAEKNDVKTFLIRVNVKDVKTLEGTCR